MPPIDFNPKFLSGVLGLLAGAIAIVCLATGFYIVDASQRGIVPQFGSFKGHRARPALAPAVSVQSHELVNLDRRAYHRNRLPRQQRNKVLKEALMLTDDENIVNIQFACSTSSRIQSVPVQQPSHR